MTFGGRLASFAQFFGLRDVRRTSLVLSPVHDAEIYVDMDDVLSRVREWLRGVPGFVIYGEYGTGKSHLLQHIGQVLAPPARLHPVFVELSGFDRHSKFKLVHSRTMQAMEEPILTLLSSNRDVKTWIATQSGLNPDMKKALVALSEPQAKPEERAHLRAWIKGTGPTPSQAARLGLSGRLFDNVGPAELVSFWKCLGEMYQQFSPTRATLLLLMDEAAALQEVVSPEGLLDIGTGIRYLVDPSNRSIGYGFGLNLPGARGVHPFMRSDVESRVHSKTVQLQTLGDEKRIIRFLDGIWHLLSAGAFFLSRDAVTFVAGHLPLLREKFGTSIATPTKTAAPTQRDLLMVLDRIAQTIWGMEHSVPLSLSDLRRIFDLL